MAARETCGIYLDQAGNEIRPRPLYRELKCIAKYGTSANRGQHPQCSAMFTVHEQITHDS